MTNRKIFIFGIGGSGARVIRSFMMLLASGIINGNDWEITPIIIDPDMENGDTTRCENLITNYVKIYNKIGLNRDNSENKFFNTKVNLLFGGEKFERTILTNSDQTFKEFINYNSLGEFQNIVQLLYSDKQLELNMKVGFKGNPHIGSVVLNNFHDSDSFFKKFADEMNSKDNLIFVISSIFGGTGSSGFPLLLKKIISADSRVSNLNNIKSAKVGASIILPYFNLRNNENSDIEPDSFFSKSYAALEYYNDHIFRNINCSYLIGDISLNSTNENIEGGSEQKNNAHFVELASALSIVNFMEKDSFLDEKGKRFEYVIPSNSDILNYVSLGRVTQEKLKNKLSYFLLLKYYLENDYKDAYGTKQAWTQMSNFKLEQFLHISIEYYLKEFHEWLEELNINKFSPYKLNITNSNEISKNLISEHIIKSNRKFLPPKNFNDIMNDNMNKLSDGKSYESTNPSRNFIDLATAALFEIKIELNK